MLSWTLIALGLNFLACSHASDQEAIKSLDYANVDPAVLREQERLIEGARLAIERISSQRVSLLRKRQVNDSHSHSDDEEDDGKYHHHDDHHDHDHGKWDIRHSVPGEPMKDYPTYEAVPSTMFTCTGLPTGYHADKEARCQVFHICSTPPLTVKSSFLCPNGSIFSQEHLVCEWWNRVNCSESQRISTIQSETDDRNTNANIDRNNVIQSDLIDKFTNLDEDNKSDVLSITDDSSINNNSNKNNTITVELEGASGFSEDKKKQMIEPMVEDEAAKLDEMNKNNISASVEDYANSNKYMNKTKIVTINEDNSDLTLQNVKTTPGYTYETPKNPFNINAAVEDYSNYNQFVDKTKTDTINEDNSDLSSQNVKTTPGYTYETPKIPFNINAAVEDYSNYNQFVNKTKTDTINEDNSDLSLQNVKTTPGYTYETPKNPFNINAAVEDNSNYNQFANKTKTDSMDEDNSNLSLDKVKTTSGYFYETPKIPFNYPTTVPPDFYLDFDLDPRNLDTGANNNPVDYYYNKNTNLNNQEINNINEGIYKSFQSTSPSTPVQGSDYSIPISTPNPISSTFDYNYNQPGGFRAGEIKQSSVSNMPFQTDTRYTTAKFSNTIDSGTIGSQTPVGFTSTTLSPPTVNENGLMIGVTEATFPKFETASSPQSVTDSNIQSSQNQFTGSDLTDTTLNFNSFSVSNAGGSGLLNVGSTTRTTSSPSVSISTAPIRSSSIDFPKADRVESSTLGFKGFSGEPFSIKSTPDLPLDDKQLVSQVTQTFEDENGTVITRVNFKFASENKTTSEETNTFENKTVTRVITLNPDQPADDFLNELNSLGQGELNVEPSRLEFETSSNSPSPRTPEETPDSQLSFARFSTASPITSSVGGKEITPSDSLIPLSNYDNQESIKTENDAIPVGGDNGSIQKYRVKQTQNKQTGNNNLLPDEGSSGSLERYRVKTPNTKNLAYYTNNPDLNNLLINNNYQSLSSLPVQGAITQRTPFNGLQSYNAFISQPVQPSVRNSYLLSQNTQGKRLQQPGNFQDLNYRYNTPQIPSSYHPQQPLFSPYFPQNHPSLSNSFVNNLDVSKMNYARNNDNNYYGKNLNFLFTDNNQAQRYFVPRKENKFEQRIFQTDIVPSVSFNFDSQEGIREFNLAVSTGLVRRKRRGF